MLNGIYNYIGKLRFPFVFLSLMMIGISMLNMKLMGISLTNPFSDIWDLINSGERLFRLPDTFNRFVLFSFSFALIIYSFTFKKHKHVKISQPFEKIIIFLLILYFFLNLITPNGLNYVSIALTIISIIYLIFFKGEIVLNRNEKLLAISSILIFYFTLSSAIFHDSNIRELDNYARFLFIMPILILLKDIKISFKVISNTISLASIAIGLFAIYSFLFNSQVRVYGFTSTATIFGNISMLYFLFSFLLYTYSRQKSLSTALPLIGMVLALLAMVLSGTRGTLTAIPFVFIFLYIMNAKKIYNIGFKESSITILLILFFTITSGLSERMIDGYNDYKLYKNNVVTSSWKNSGSIMPRMIIWEGSMNMIKNHPIKGVGLDNFNASLDSQIMSKDIPPIRIDPKNFSAGFNHAHNQFLDIFAKIGIFGFLLILLLLYSFYRIFFDALKNKNTQIFAILGLTTLICYFAYMFTHVILSHQQSTLFMLYTLTIFASLISNETNVENSS
ncbi:MAG: O-antigen ligase family protein [Gammaproteobacteria bacterium]